MQAYQMQADRSVIPQSKLVVIEKATRGDLHQLNNHDHDSLKYPGFSKDSALFLSTLRDQCFADL